MSFEFRKLLLVSSFIATGVIGFEGSSTSQRWPSNTDKLCGHTDLACMNSLALKYVNRIRKAAGKLPIAMGTKAMFENAMNHSRSQANLGKCYHQDIRSLNNFDVMPCQTFISGENIARTLLKFPKSPSSNPALRCVTQWRKSRNHYLNLVSNYHKETVIAIHVDTWNRIWCTQTFAVNTRFGSGQCAKAGGYVESPSPFPSPTTSPIPAPIIDPQLIPYSYKFKYSKVRLRFSSGVIHTFLLRCAQGICRLCSEKNLAKCYSPKFSIRIDKYLRTLMKQ